MKSVILFLIFMGAVALTLSSCASKLIVKNCEHVGLDVFKCEKVIGRDYK